MSVRNTGKRRRSNQPTLVEIFERQRVRQRSKKTRSLNMTDVIEVNSSQEEEPKSSVTEVNTEVIDDNNDEDDEDKSLLGDKTVETLKHMDEKTDKASLEALKDMEDNLRVNQEASSIHEESGLLEDKNELESSFDDKEDVSETIVETTDKETLSDTGVKVQANSGETLCEENVGTTEKSINDTREGVRTMEKSNNDTQKDVGTMEESNDDTQEDVGTAEKSNDDTQEDVGTMEESSDDTQEDVGTTEKSNDDTQEDVGKTEERKGDTQEDVGTTEESNDDTQEDVETTEESNDDTQEDAGKTEERKGDTQEDVGTTEESNNDTQEDVGTTEESNDDTQEDVGTTEESNDDTQDFELLQQESQNNIDEEPVRLGVEFDSLLRAPGCCGRNRTLSPGSAHTILFRPYQPAQPYPSKYRDKWDRDHVRMPCSEESLYPSTDGKANLLRRWELICRSLKTPIASSYDLQDAIFSYNSHYVRQWDFRLLHIFFVEKISEEENIEFFKFILPGIIRLALRLPQICTQAIPLLKRQQEHTITMSQQQAASLLANAFLCTFPRRNSTDRNGQHEFRNYPNINFNRLFQLGDHRKIQKKIEKLKCIFHYFKRVLKQPPCGTISYQRQVLKPDETPKWHSCNTKLCRLRVCSDGTIEDNAPGLLQVDFANKFVGGGVLGEGCVQEEIRFAICPELIVSRLFTEGLEDNECLIVTGAERFSDYVGYAQTFQWAKNHDDESKRDSWGRFHTEIVAIDAKPRVNYSEQFSPANLKRELEKAYCGFLSRYSVPEHLPAVATGNWGCGAFNGDPQLKSLIQIMAASVAHRDVLYLTFNEKEHAKELYDVHSILKSGGITIGFLWKMLNEYKRQISSDASTPQNLFGYIRGKLGRNDEQNDVTDSTLDANSASSSPLLFEDSIVYPAS